MTMEEFQELTGENPIDVLGENWEEYAEEYVEDAIYADRAKVDARLEMEK
jgi:hypothetical protein